MVRKKKTKKNSRRQKTEAPQTLPALIPIYLENLAVRRYSPGTVNLYRKRLLDFAEWTLARGLSRASEVELDTLELYGVELHKLGFAASTRHDTLCVLSVFFKWLYRKRHILHDPSDGLDLKPAKSLERQPITHDEVERLAGAIDLMTPLGLRDRAIVEVLYSTAMRVSELCGLELYDIDASRGLVVIRKGKGRKQRVVPIGERALLWVDRYLRFARSPLTGERISQMLFVGRNAEPLERRRIAARIHRYGIKALVEKSASPHVLRHTTATEMLARGADTRVLQELLGHSSLASTQRYTHLAIEELRAVHAQTHPAESSQAAGFPDPEEKRPLRADRRRRKA
jgi:integrase/recombinase XerD